jgi:TusA-related sulfurtransferase
VADRLLDTSGHFCPAPILMTEEEMGRMKKGEVLRVIFTDPGARPDLEAWCRMAGHTVVEMHWDKKTGTAWIRK